jgi:ABC-2 type transport system permease protein
VGFHRCPDPPLGGARRGDDDRALPGRRPGLHVELTGEGVLGIVVAVVLGTAAFAALGVGVTVLMPTTEAASTIAPFAGVMLGFISGSGFPWTRCRAGLLRWGASSRSPTWPSRSSAPSPTPRGTGLTENVAVLAAWGIAGLVVAARGFRWEPQAHRG